MRRRQCLLVLLVVMLCLPALVRAQGSADEARLVPPAPGLARAPFDKPLALKIETPDGTYFVKLVGESDGPARIPLPTTSGLQSLQVAASLGPAGRVSVALSAVENELFITPIGSYHLQRTSKDPILLEDLIPYGLLGWTMSVGTIDEAGVGGCCGCGAVSCCPNAGKCLTCGDCGACCRKPAV